MSKTKSVSLGTEMAQAKRTKKERLAVQKQDAKDAKKKGKE